MSIFEKLEVSLHTACEEALESYHPNTLIIFSNQSGQEPSNPYIVLDVLFNEQIGRTQTSTRADPVYGEGGEIAHYTLNSQAHYEVTVQVSCIGSEAGTLAFDFHHLLNTTLVWEKFQLQNLYPIRKTDIRRSPVLRETKWVDRYNFDVTFTFAVSTNQTVDIIEYLKYRIELVE